MEFLDCILDLFKYINQNFGELIVAVIIGVEGALAIWEYYQEKRDKKQDAALLILQEIRYAEERITESLGNNGRYEYLPAIRLLPTNSWSSNIHLYINDLLPYEIDEISAFYARAKYIDFILEQMTEDYIKMNSILNVTDLFYNNHNILAQNLLHVVSNRIVLVDDAIKDKLKSLA